MILTKEKEYNILLALFASAALAGLKSQPDLMKDMTLEDVVVRCFDYAEQMLDEYNKRTKKD